MGINLKLKHVIACVVSATILFGTVCAISAPAKKADAATRNVSLLSENFLSEELESKKWSLEQGDENKISPMADGNGTLSITVKETGNMASTLFFNKFVKVDDTEDLVIEYSITDFKSALSGKNDVIQNVMLVKGLGSEVGGSFELPQNSANSDIDAKLEGIASFREGDKFYTGVGYSLRSGVTSFNASESQISIANSKRNKAVVDYYKSLFEEVQYNGQVAYNVPYNYDNVSVDPESGLEPVSPRWWIGETFGNYVKNSDTNVEPYYFSEQDEIDKYLVYHIFEKGYTFKHVYGADGGYKCYVKTNGARDLDYYLFAELSAKIPNTEEKRFINRSGFVGFNVYGNSFSMDLDFFKVYTSVGETATTHGTDKHDEINVGFSLSEDGERYLTQNNGINDWAETVDTFQIDSRYTDMGYVFNNPSLDNYLYSGSKYRLKYDGKFDDYVNFDAKFSIRELTAGKDFGFLFGGTSIDNLFNRNGMVFIYLTVKEGQNNYFLGVDYVEQQKRVRVGALKDTGIPIVNGDDESQDYNINIKAKQEGGVAVRVYDGNGVDLNGELKWTHDKLVLKNRFAIYSANNSNYNEQTSSAVIVMKNLDVFNKYYYAFPGASGVDVEENFDGKDENGAFKINEGFEIYEGEYNPYYSDAGVFVEDGKLVMRGVGYRSGISILHAYNSFELYFDVVDIQREIEYGDNGSVLHPVSSAPIIIEFGNMSEGLSGGLGSSLVIRNPMKIINENGERKLEVSQHSETLDIDKAIGDVEEKSIIAFHHDKTYEDFGSLRHNLLDPALDGKTVRFKLEFSEYSILSLSYCVLGLEDESILDVPIYSMEYYGGEGYIGITSSHNNKANSFSCDMALDNIKVVNTDTLSLVQPEEEEELVVDEPSQERQLKWLIYLGVGVVVLAAAATLIVLVIKKKKTKGSVLNNEVSGNSGDGEQE